MIDVMTGALFFGVPLSLGLLGYGAVRLHEMQAPPVPVPVPDSAASPTGSAISSNTASLTASAVSVAALQPSLRRFLFWGSSDLLGRFVDLEKEILETEAKLRRTVEAVEGGDDSAVPNLIEEFQALSALSGSVRELQLRNEVGYLAAAKELQEFLSRRAKVPFPGTPEQDQSHADHTADDRGSPTG